MPPKFFVTHSWKDIEFAHRLCDDLHANGLEGFFDAHSMSPGDSIPSRIERGLKECDVYIPVFSPDSLQSDWCDWEIDMAITMNRTRKGRPRIIPVIAKPCDVPDRLMHLLYVNFVGRYDDALSELLTKGFGLPAARTAPPLPPPPIPSVVSPPSSWKNWLVLFGTVIVFGITALIIANGVFIAQSTTPTPPAIAISTLVTPTTAAVVIPTTIAMTPTPDAPKPTSTATPLPPTRASTPTATSLPPTSTPASKATRVPTAILGIGSTKIAKDGSPMMYIPAGEFLMGSTAADTNASSDEKPQHPVYLDAFWIGKYDVTNALYKKCVDSGLCSVPGFWANGTFPSGKENHPVVGVSWVDAVDYAIWAGGRLPTEAEWEKAACWDEAKKLKRMYPWGDVFDGQKANTNESRIYDTTAVGKYSPQGDSPYGVSDIVGNVWQWVADWYGINYYSISLKDNPQGPNWGTDRVLRGGAWSGSQDDARCASRLGYHPDSLDFDYFGFRIAESVTP